MSTQFYWNGKYVSSHDLLLDEFLPMAFKGLYSIGVSPKDAEYYLKIIKDRVRGNNSSEWIVRNYRSLLKSHKRYESMQLLTANMYEKQEKGYPVSIWSMLHHTGKTRFKANYVIKHIMSSDIFSVDKNDSIDLVISIMKWKNIHHMPVINSDRELLGLITSTDVDAYLNTPKRKHNSVEKLMKTDLITVEEFTPIATAKKLMETSAIGSLPVVNNNKLIGLVTRNDF
jgi:CBS domain-containing protein